MIINILIRNIINFIFIYLYHMFVSPLSKILASFVKQDLLNERSSSNRHIFQSSSPMQMQIFKHLFDSLAKSHQICKTNHISVHQIEDLTNGPFINKESVSSYIPESIRSHILSNLDRERVFQFMLGDRIIQVHIIYSENRQRLSNSVILGMIYRMYLWLSIIIQYASAQCAHNLNIFVFFSEKTKHMPVSKTNIIGREHVNTAFTTSCQPDINIHIFRQEEWFKVFIHESFHCFGLDFSAMNMATELGDDIIKGHFGLQNGIDLRIYETYTETWAEIIHTFIYGFIRCNVRSWENVFRNFAKFLKNEQMFSIFQCCKVLNQNGLSYRNVCEKSMQRYNEKSHIFSYYILKSELLFHINDFMDWCILNNGSRNESTDESTDESNNTSLNKIVFRKTTQNIREFCKLLMNLSCQTEYISIVSEIEQKILYYKQMSKPSHEIRDIMNTLRMTIYG